MKGLVAFLAATAIAASTAAASVSDVRVSPVGRLRFPERGYVVDVPPATSLGQGTVRVVENGRAVRRLRVVPLAASGVRSGAVLAVDTSDSMVGAPAAAAWSAARTFVAARPSRQSVGVVAFDGHVRVLQSPTVDTGALARALSAPPALAYGTHIYDAAAAGVAMLARAGVGAGAVVLLSDGADVGSTTTAAEVVSRARRAHVRVFTVGLRSKTFDQTALRALAAETGGSYVIAAGPSQLRAIYGRLGRRLANAYLIDYRSTAKPGASVDVQVSIAGVGVVHDTYTAPAPGPVAPFRRSLLQRFLRSPASLVLISLIGGLLVGLVLHLLLRRRTPTLIERVGAFVGTPQRATARATLGKRLRERPLRALDDHGWVARLERDLDVAQLPVPASRAIASTLGCTVVAAIALGLAAPVLSLLALIVPLGARSYVARRVRAVQVEFADQLPPNLQVLASALRAGHSFTGAMSVAAENAHDPARREFRRVLADEQLGTPVDEALRRVAERMRSRDLEQVALLAELQRTTGGNAAEVLDTVVDTIRERSDIRLLVRSLTAQGRMARWILTALPVVCGLALWTVQPALMRPMVHSGVGQLALVLAAGMVAAGSVLIQRIVEIEV